MTKHASDVDAFFSTLKHPHTDALRARAFSGYSAEIGQTLAASIGVAETDQLACIGLTSLTHLTHLPTGADSLAPTRNAS